ncbi:hypothetical protein [Streptomyces pseudogriseolus]|uniref:hypothetical protein n=1 Tax=Streptomyces pseudogriseolus TaxID=36817 RepID=UPI003FA2D351
MTTTRTTLPRTRKTTVHSDSHVIPFVIQREGEEAAPDNLRLTPIEGGRYRLRYADEDPRDRDLRGVLWARCAFSEVDDEGRPMGRPQWRMMHPLRQRGCMQTLRCQICAGPARTPLGWIFLAGPSTRRSLHGPRAGSSAPFRRGTCAVGCAEDQQPSAGVLSLSTLSRRVVQRPRSNPC